MKDRRALRTVDVLRHHRQIAQVDRVRRRIENQTRERRESRSRMRIGQAVQPTRSPDARGPAERALRVVGDPFQVGAAANEHHLTPDRPDEMQILQRPADLAPHRVEPLADPRDALRALDSRPSGAGPRARDSFDPPLIIARSPTTPPRKPLDPPYHPPTA